MTLSTGKSKLGSMTIILAAPQHQVTSARQLLLTIVLSRGVVEARSGNTQSPQNRSRS